MTNDQYERWKDFARRMVVIVRNARHRSPSRAHVLEYIEFFFECRMDPDDEWRRVVNWDNTERTDGGHWPMPVCDHVRDIAEYHVPTYWALDDGPAYENAIDRWVNPPACCIRAALDLAVAPSAGVYGFNVGDIRKMYPEGVPDWIKQVIGSYDQAISVEAIVPGIGFIPKYESVSPVAFDELPADADLVL